jgi:hypothetical protein
LADAGQVLAHLHGVPTFEIFTMANFLGLRVLIRTDEGQAFWKPVGRSGPMAIHELLAGKSFDPEDVAVLNTAFQGVCADLGVTDKTPHSRENVAKKVIELADGQGDPDAIRAAVVASLSERR